MRNTYKYLMISTGILLLSGSISYAQQSAEPTIKEQMDAALQANRDNNITADDNISDDFSSSLVLENTTDEPRPLYPETKPVAVPQVKPQTVTRPTPVRTVTTTRPAEKTVTFSRKDIVFGFDSAELQPNANGTLRQLASVMSSPEYASVVFRIEGHTDAHGAEAYNMALSNRRAAAVQSYLQSAGVPASRLRAVGKGETQLINASAPYSAANRRVVIVPADKK